MAEYESGSIPALIRGVVNDTRELVREELALARAELREELAAAQGAGISFGAAALVAVIAVVLFCVALGGAIAHLFELSAWVGYGIMALLLAGAAYFLMSRGRTQLATVRGLPKTKASLRENMEWIRSKSSSR